MNTAVSILKYALAALVVVTVFGLFGWYFFIDSRIEQTTADDQARGFGETPSFASSLGSTFQNIASNLADTFSIADDTNGQAQAGKRAPRLWAVTKSPVAGAGFASTTSQLFFVERGSGNMLKADPATSAVERITNTVLPRIYEALFATDGSVILRSISDEGAITSYAARLSTTTPSESATSTPQTLQGVYLSQNISAISSPGTNRIVSVIPSANGSIGVTSDWQGKNQKSLFTSVLSNWTIHALSDGKIYAVQKAADNASGYAFQVSSNGTFTPILSNISGLTVLPRANSEALIYSRAANGTFTLFARTNRTATAVTLPIQTISEKCVWVPGQILIAYCAVPQSTTGVTLNEWYQGAKHTSDTWWRVDVSAGTATQIFTPNTAIDVENPRIDAAGAYIAFMNANDKSLWMLRTAE